MRGPRHRHAGAPSVSSVRPSSSSGAAPPCWPGDPAELTLAADYLRFFAGQARAELSRPTRLPGPTGESNELSLHARGIFACIASTGAGLARPLAQVAAALAAGNRVIAWHRHPALASLPDLLREAGLPDAVLFDVATGGDGSLEDLVSDPRIDGVAVAGPPALAKALGRVLAAREGPIRPLVVHAAAGDESLSAGNPLAAGPHYLHRFMVERTLSIDTTAAGGNASLLSLGEEQAF
jgi:RHH-type proline utilization regulon transcriptional repressor/proline dehydrogenase/delta 1-pyrroline-5-carboxylate dehydrogenase